MNDPGSIDDQTTVLVVDDETETADLYTNFLTEEYEVRTAYSGEEALDTLDADVAVVLLDRRMPGMSGDEVLKTIREREPDCRVVMVTAIEPDLDILDLPFDDYLVKPVTQDSMLDTVSAMLARNTYDDTIQEIFSLVSRMATLESKMTIEELEASEEYAATKARYMELMGETDLGEPSGDLYTGFATDKIRALFGEGQLDL